MLAGADHDAALVLAIATAHEDVAAPMLFIKHAQRAGIGENIVRAAVFS